MRDGSIEHEGSTALHGADLRSSFHVSGAGAGKQLGSSWKSPPVSNEGS